MKAVFDKIRDNWLTVAQLARDSVLVKPVNTPITPLCSKIKLVHIVVWAAGV